MQKNFHAFFNSITQPLCHCSADRYITLPDCICGIKSSQSLINCKACFSINSRLLQVPLLLITLGLSLYNYTNRCQPAFDGSELDSSSLTSCNFRYAVNAPSRSPLAIRTSPAKKTAPFCRACCIIKRPNAHIGKLLTKPIGPEKLIAVSPRVKGIPTQTVNENHIGFPIVVFTAGYLYAARSMSHTPIEREKLS